MSDLKVTAQDEKVEQEAKAEKSSRTEQRPKWETPRLEDVSEQVMAQPYIRFT
ncbi:MAG TPA: hypothetical protein VMK05_09355 [Burkholderiales bacterium]|nr:hypothetical protein [Burkholderiales bacterium]